MVCGTQEQFKASYCSCLTYLLLSYLTGYIESADCITV